MIVVIFMRIGKMNKINKAWKKITEINREYKDLEGECPECEESNYEIIEEPDFNQVTYRCLECGYEHSEDMVK